TLYILIAAPNYRVGERIHFPVLRTSIVWPSSAAKTRTRIQMAQNAPAKTAQRIELPERETMEFDVVIVGAGPAGLSAAIRLKQLAAENGTDISVVVLEKGSEAGAHILSGAVIDPIGLDSLIPNWREEGAPVTQEVTKDKFLYLGP